MTDDEPMTNGSVPAVGPHYRLRLFVAGTEPNSGKAQLILARLCEEHLKDRFELKIVDILEDYQAAIDNHVVVVPTLIVESPASRTVIVGSLSDEVKVLAAFGISQGEVRT
jgi:circadian clock protein KaiB